MMSENEAVQLESNVPAPLTPVEVPAAPAQEGPQVITRRMLGQLRRRYLTVVLPEVIACGHKLDQGRTPNNHCDDCWDAYFSSGVDLVLLHDELQISVNKTVAKYGKNFLKQFRRFMERQLAKTPVPAPVDRSFLYEGNNDISKSES
jgi:hypothetical protein